MKCKYHRNCKNYLALNRTCNNMYEAREDEYGYRCFKSKLGGK